MPDVNPEAMEAELAAQLAQEAQGLPPEETLEGGAPTTPDASAEENFLGSAPPPGLEEQYKGMQAAFTKKMQGLADAQRKAQLFDTIFADENLKRQVLGTGGNQPPKPAAFDPNEYLKYSPEEEQLVANFKDDLKGLHAVADRRAVVAAYRVLQPAFDQVMPLLQSMKTELEALKAERATEQVAAKYPQLAGRMQEVLAFEAKGLTREQAIGALLGPGGASQNNGSKTQPAPAARLNTSRPTLATAPGGPSVQGKPTQANGTERLESSFQRAERMLDQILRAAPKGG